jgi:GDP-4-dehydro-6-deoxy-D-mannose reductase
MKILITGITGFVGSHLAEYLLTKQDIEVYGIIRWRSDTKNIEHIKNRLIIYEADIRDFMSMRSVIEKIMPDRIFHLAAQSFVGTSFHAPQETLTTNIIGQLNIFEAVKSLKINPLIQIAGSSEEYGLVYEDELPVKETNPLRPLSPYAVSKVTQDLLGYQYFKSYGLNVIRTRAFNHTGIRRGEPFVCSNFSKQIALIEKGKQKPVIYTGNLEAIRDFTDVRDIVIAYWLSLEKATPGEVYNISSGKGYKIGEILDILLSFTDIKIEIKQDHQRFRPSDVPVLIGDAKKFREKTGWKPQIPFKDTLKDLLNWWRSNPLIG